MQKNPSANAGVLGSIPGSGSSPVKLIVGGRAKLVRLASSHQVAISGRSVCRPRARIMVRLWIRS